MVLNCACQFVLTFPLVLMVDLMLFNNSEIWVGLGQSGFDNLFSNCDYVTIIIVMGFSVLTLLRPLTQFHGVKKLSMH